MELTQLWELVRGTVARVTDLAPEEIHPARTLESLGIDSLVAVELIVEVEGQVGVELDADLLRHLEAETTLGELIAAIIPLPGASRLAGP